MASALLATFSVASEHFELALVEPLEPAVTLKTSDIILNENFTTHFRFSLNEHEVDSAKVDLHKESGPIGISSGGNTHYFHTSVLIKFKLTDEHYDLVAAKADQIVQPMIEKYGESAVCERLDFFGQRMNDGSRIVLPKLYLVLLKSDRVLFTQEARLYCNNKTKSFHMDLISEQGAVFPIQSHKSPQGH
jgi:hypothetical protein